LVDGPFRIVSITVSGTKQVPELFGPQPRKKPNANKQKKKKKKKEGGGGYFEKVSRSRNLDGTPTFFILVVYMRWYLAF
jgi:hypothetical protein